MTRTTVKFLSFALFALCAIQLSTINMNAQSFSFASKERLMSQTNQEEKVRNVVLVHGGFVDGSGWEGVYKILTEEGYNVTVVQNPTISLADDVAVTKRAIDAQDGPVILVGHSYGGVVISSAGDDPKVVGLVYICAFAADTGESVLSLIKTAPAGAPAPPILPPQDGFLFLDRQKFAASFAADVKPEIADFMANSQVPWGLAAASGGATAAAWKAKPSWYLLTTEDHMIAPELQRFMSKRAGQGKPCDLRLAARRGGDFDRKSRQRRAACSSTLTPGGCAGPFPSWNYSGAL
jgi:pimeloyl-ACP methyl ester carboxylesterase